MWTRLDSQVAGVVIGVVLGVITWTIIADNPHTEMVRLVLSFGVTFFGMMYFGIRMVEDDSR